VRKSCVEHRQRRYANYQAKDFEFGQAFPRRLSRDRQRQAPARTHPAHLSAPERLLRPRLAIPAAAAVRAGRQHGRPGHERAASRKTPSAYEATLRFLNGQIKTMLTAINGQ